VLFHQTNTAVSDNCGGRSRPAMMRLRELVAKAAG
jgi:hypothetical protein